MPRRAVPFNASIHDPAGAAWDSIGLRDLVNEIKVAPASPGGIDTDVGIERTVRSIPGVTRIDDQLLVA